MATDLLDAATATTVELSTGLVLLLAAPAMRGGDFTVGNGDGGLVTEAVRAELTGIQRSTVADPANWLRRL